MSKMNNVVFVGTANNVSNLPEALLRKGRFDNIFWIDLPTGKERKSIYQIHLKENGVSLSTDQLTEAVKLTRGWTGAELEYSVKEGKRMTFAESEGEKDLTFSIMKDIIEREIPQSVAFSEAAENAREKLKTIATPSSSDSRFAKLQKEVLTSKASSTKAKKGAAKYNKK